LERGWLGALNARLQAAKRAFQTTTLLWTPLLLEETSLQHGDPRAA
jgi:hypothetical protein